MKIVRRDRKLSIWMNEIEEYHKNVDHIIIKYEMRVLERSEAVLATRRPSVHSTHWRILLLVGGSPHTELTLTFVGVYTKCHRTQEWLHWAHNIFLINNFYWRHFTLAHQAHTFCSAYLSADQRYFRVPTGTNFSNCLLRLNTLISY